MAEDHTWQEYANQDNVDDAYQDMQEGLCDEIQEGDIVADQALQDTFAQAFNLAPEVMAEKRAKYDRVASEILRRDGKAEWREWRAYRIGGAVALALLVQTAVLAWAVYHVGQGAHRRASGTA